jgi:hypothetical protein
MRSSLLALFVISGCTSSEVDLPTPPPGWGGKSDTGWVADTSYEVGADIESTITRAATGSYSDLATNKTKQEELVDDQIKYCKTTMAKRGYHINQLYEKVEIVEVKEEDGKVTLRYKASIDLLHKKSAGAEVPRLEEIDQREFEVKLPLDPTNVKSRNGESCAADWGDHWLAEYNYYYYFAPDKEGCEEEMFIARLSLREVYPVRTVYPEYDKLLGPLDEAQGTVGFRAAILPNRGDDDPMSRHDAHRDMIEHELNLTGEEKDDGKVRRYAYEMEVPDRGKVMMIVDLFDPTKGSFTSTFRKALGEYQLVFYNGHSGYGTKPFLTEADAFSDAYQIVMMHSCRSYSYYSRQVFRAKATDADPTGFVAADVVATGKSSYPYDSPRTLKPLLRGLWKGLHSVHEGKPGQAPSWQSMVGDMNDVTWGILYGVAGVRDNAWQPPAPEPPEPDQPQPPEPDQPEPPTP